MSWLTLCNASVGLHWVGATGRSWANQADWTCSGTREEMSDAASRVSADQDVINDIMPVCEQEVHDYERDDE